MYNKLDFDNDLISTHNLDPRWKDPLFRDFKLLHPKTKGKVGEQIVESIYKKKGHRVLQPRSTQYDRIINGKRVEIKASTVTDGSSDHFSILQIREDYDYDQLLMLLCYFDHFRMYALDKNQISDLIKRDILKPQHGGKNGSRSNYLYNGPINNLGAKEIIL